MTEPSSTNSPDEASPATGFVDPESGERGAQRQSPNDPQPRNTMTLDDLYTELGQHRRTCEPCQQWKFCDERRRIEADIRKMEAVQPAEAQAVELFTLEFIAQQMELKNRAYPRPWRIEWERGKAFLFARRVQVAAFTIGSSDEADYAVAAANHYPDALKAIERFQQIEAAGKEYVESLMAWRKRNDTSPFDPQPESNRLVAAEARLRELLGFPQAGEQGA